MTPKDTLYQQRCRSVAIARAARIAKASRSEVIAQRFWSKVEKHGPDDCWPWKGGRDGFKRYGLFLFKRKRMPAHRAGYIIVFGDFDRTLDVCHSCDNPPCCNPKHWFLGTTLQNIQDCINKGRWRQPPPQPGELNPQAILTETQVIEILALLKTGQLSQRAIARAFGVNYRTINVIHLGINWPHLHKAGT